MRSHVSINVTQYLWQYPLKTKAKMFEMFVGIRQVDVQREMGTIKHNMPSMCCIFLALYFHTCLLTAESWGVKDKVCVFIFVRLMRGI